MKKILLLIAFSMSLIPLSSNAEDAEIDNIYYSLEMPDDSETGIGVAKVIGHDDKQFYKGDIVIPEEITYNGNKYIVTQIGNGCFGGTTALNSVTCANSIKSIEAGAFAYSSAKRIILPDSLTSIQWDLFINSTQLEYVKCGVTSVVPDSRAYMGCTSLTKVEIPEENPYYFADDYCIYKKNVTVYNATGLKLVAVYNKNCNQLKINDNTVSILGHVCENDTNLRSIKGGSINSF